MDLSRFVSVGVMQGLSCGLYIYRHRPLIYTINIILCYTYMTLPFNSFDLTRRRRNMSKTNSLASRTASWPHTRALLESLPPERLTFGAHQAERNESISDPAINELLKFVGRVGSTATNSDEKKSYMRTAQVVHCLSWVPPYLLNLES